MSENLQTIDLRLDGASEAMALFGTNDKHLKHIEEQLSVSIVTRGEQVSVSGSKEDMKHAEEVLVKLISLIRKGMVLSERDVIYAVDLAKAGKIDQFAALFEDEITKNYHGKSIRAKTLGQRTYIQSVQSNDLVFGIGPAGTGKTYLAVVMAIRALKNGLVKRIVLTRPAVEAGESLGFLPGDLKEKVDPYLRPLYDALNDVFGSEHTARLIEREVIEIAPLAYMRGRTLDEAFVILDEAQNTTPEQMKMFLTRLGFGSKMIINGDITQADLPRGTQSGLHVASHILAFVKGIGFVYLDQTDVVRHPLVQRIIDAYETNKEL